MAAAYDTYDYPSYWVNRRYEHEAEILALRSLIAKIPKAKNILEIGAGYGRLTPSYVSYASKITLSDPSAKLLNLAKKNLPYKKIEYVKSKLENLTSKVENQSVDLVVIVRVLHHIKDVDKAFFTVNKLLKKNGHFILEFANKQNIKTTFFEMLRGNLTYPLDIFPKDRRSKKGMRKCRLPFCNYHPDLIIEKLKNHHFEIVDKRSVSNIRSPLLKKFLIPEVLVFCERYLQRPLSYINFGPSIFLLSRKR